MSKPEEFKFDSRVRDRFLRSRVLSSAELQKHLDELPDLEGEYEISSDTPQPAVAPPRSEVTEEPLVFDGIRRLQALSEASSPAPAPRYVAPAPAPAPPPASTGLPAYREPEARPLGTPLRSALMESEISGVGAGAVSAALGAMAAEARGASVFGVPASMSQPSSPQPPLAQPSSPQPPLAQPSSPQPPLAQPSSPQPPLVQPTNPQPPLAQPSIPQPPLAQPSSPQALPAQPSSPQPSIQQASSLQPVPPSEEAVPPVTLRSEPSGPAAPLAGASGEAERAGVDAALGEADDDEIDGDDGDDGDAEPGRGDLA